MLADASYHAFASLSAGAIPPDPDPLGEGHGEGGVDDVTVIAVIDSALNPYHWDFLASKMPQTTNADPGDDVPLDRPASEWLDGFPAASDLGSFDRLDLSLEEDDATESMTALSDKDSERWAAVTRTTPGEKPHVVWMPRTKVIAAASFGTVDADPVTGTTRSALIGDEEAHGLGTTSASVGNVHGTCPECLLVFLQYSGEAGGEAAIEWAMKQPWIDAISNSYGFQTVGDHGPVQVRDNVYSGSDNGAQKAAIERGQTVLFSAGNGIENAFVTPNSTTFSSQKGPDWMLTVGAVCRPGNGVYPAFSDEFLGADVTEEKAGGFVGAGKPVDVASLGIDYPTAYTSTTVGGTGSIGFSGTSNATPVVAGIYGRSLYTARTQLAGESRTQAGGVDRDGRARRMRLGAHRLRARRRPAHRQRAAEPSPARRGAHGQRPDHLGPAREPDAAEGRRGDAAGGGPRGLPRPRYGRPGRVAHRAAAGHRSVDRPGRHARPARRAGERDWMVVDSYCRQRNWGSWGGGYYVEGTTGLPGDHPSWPVRSLLSSARVPAGRCDDFNRGLTMKKAFTTAVLMAVALVPAGAAQAALEPTPGVAFVNQYSFSSRFDPTVSSRAAYIGGPLTANRLDVRVSGTSQFNRTVTFEQPSTLMIPGPLETVADILLSELPWLVFGLEPEHCAGHPDIPGLRLRLRGSDLQSALGECAVSVVTRLARETIVLRHDPSMLGVPCRVAINSERGNDVIDSRDSIATTVFCAGGINRVIADLADSVSSTCEVVTRS